MGSRGLRVRLLFTLLFPLFPLSLPSLCPLSCRRRVRANPYVTESSGADQQKTGVTDDAIKVRFPLFLSHPFYIADHSRPSRRLPPYVSPIGSYIPRNALTDRLCYHRMRHPRSRTPPAHVTSSKRSRPHAPIERPRRM